MSREFLEITLKEGTDAMKACDQLNTFINIKCNVVDLSTIRVWFNPDRIVAKKILKIVQSVCNPDKSTRKKNIEHIKQLSE